MSDPSKTRRQRFEAAAALFHVACELEVEELHAFLREACGGDELLVAEVQALLAADRRFVETLTSEHAPGGREEGQGDSEEEANGG